MALSSAINNNGIVVETQLKMDKLALKDMGQSMMLGMFKLAGAIAQKARANAPVQSSALVNSIRIEEDGYDVYIRAGGIVSQTSDGSASKKVDYALRREYENNLHPWRKHYMKRANDSEMSGDWQRYFKEELK